MLLNPAEPLHPTQGPEHTLNPQPSTLKALNPKGTNSKSLKVAAHHEVIAEEFDLDCGGMLHHPKYPQLGIRV